MEFTKIVHLREDLWVINELDKTFLYLIKGAEKALLLDTGLGISDLHGIIDSICGPMPCIVINSHAHGDHNSGNFLFSCVHVGRFDEPYSHRQMSEEERLLSKEAYFTEAIENGYDFTAWKPGPAETMITVREGDLFDLGDHILRVIEIPGHTAGSIALLDEKYGWIFTGDTVLTWQTWGHLTDSILNPSVSLKNYWESIKKLRKITAKINTVFPSHGKRDGNPKGYTQYTLQPEIFEIYDEGIADIFAGRAQTEIFRSPWNHDALVAMFRIGGIVYNPKRLL